MNFKYTLILIVFIFYGLINAQETCSCPGNGNSNTGGPVLNRNDPSVISDPIVRIYGHWDFQGSLFIYNQTDGFMVLPPEFRNNVQSFQSGIDVCFMRWYPKQQVQIYAGQYHKNYAALTNFGQYMDSLYAGRCEDIICSVKPSQSSEQPSQTPSETPSQTPAASSGQTSN